MQVTIPYSQMDYFPFRNANFVCILNIKNWVQPKIALIKLMASTSARTSC